MHDFNGITAAPETGAVESSAGKNGVVSTHVLVGEDLVEKLRELSMRTRVAQSVAKQLALPNLQVKWVKVTVENRIPSVVNGTSTGCTRLASRM